MSAAGEGRSWSLLYFRDVPELFQFVLLVFLNTPPYLGFSNYLRYSIYPTKHFSNSLNHAVLRSDGVHSETRGSTAGVF